MIWLKKWLAILSLCVALPATAGSYTFNDTVAMQTAYPWVEIARIPTGVNCTTNTNNSTFLSLTNNALAVAPLGFNFVFGGVTYTSLEVSSNGFVQLAGAGIPGANTNKDLVDVTTGFVGLLPFWADLVPYKNITYATGSCDGVYYKTQGAAPNRVFILEFNSIPKKNTSNSDTTFQLQLHENNNVVVFSYQTAYLSGLEATVGVVVSGSGGVPTAGDYTQYSFNQASVVPPTTIVWNSSVINHFEVEFTPDNQALTCMPKNMIVRACTSSTGPCTNVADQSAALSSVSLTTTLGSFSGGLSSKTISLTGNITETLSSTAIGTATITAGGSIPLSCYSGATLLASCQVTFSDTGLVFDWQSNLKTGLGEGVLDAGNTSSVVKISAVKKADNSKSCVGFVPSVSPSMSVTYSDPVTGTIPLQVTPTTIAGVATNATINVTTSQTSVPFAWDANGNTYMVVRYVDAGKIQINAAISSPLADGNTALISKPYQLRVYNAVSDVTCANGSIMLADTTQNFCPSGELFTAKVRGYSTGGVILPNFGKESATANLTFSGNLQAPLLGFEGVIKNEVSSSTAALATGVNVAKNYTCVGLDCYLLASLSWDNVGEINLNASIAGDNYFGAGAITSKIYQPFGKFYPSALKVNSFSLINRFDSVCVPGSTFSYMGEKMKVTINLSAVNKQGNTTSNYDHPGFDVSSNASWNIKAVSGVNALTSRMNLISGVGTWTNGVLDASLDIALNRDTNPDGPFLATSIGIAPTDSNGLIVAAYNLDTNADTLNDALSIGSTDIYFGRMKIGNQTGSELLPLPIPVEAQYYNGYGFVTNALDNCTTLNSARFSTLNFAENLIATEVSFVYPTQLVAGKQTLLMNKPSGGDGVYNGSFDVTYDLATDNKTYLESKWIGATYTDNPKSKIVLAKNKTQNKLIFIKQNF
jgi:MSHA biogenesis protein MshQ